MSGEAEGADRAGPDAAAATAAAAEGEKKGDDNMDELFGSDSGDESGGDTKSAPAASAGPGAASIAGPGATSTAASTAASGAMPDASAVFGSDDDDDDENDGAGDVADIFGEDDDDDDDDRNAGVSAGADDMADIFGNDDEDEVDAEDGAGGFDFFRANGPVQSVNARISVSAPEALNEGKLWAVRLPSTLGLEPEPFSPETFVAKKRQVDKDDDGGFELYARWRVGPGGKRESNTRLVRWSDGSETLIVGDEYFDVERKVFPAVQQSGASSRKRVQTEALFADVRGAAAKSSGTKPTPLSEPGSTLLLQSRLEGELVVRAMDGVESRTRQARAQILTERQLARPRVKRVFVNEVELAERERELEKEAAEEAKGRRQRESKRRSNQKRRKRTRIQMQRDFLETNAEFDDEDERYQAMEGGGYDDPERLLSAQKRARVVSKRSARTYVDEGEELLGDDGPQDVNGGEEELGEEEEEEDEAPTMRRTKLVRNRAAVVSDDEDDDSD